MKSFQVSVVLMAILLVLSPDVRAQKLRSGDEKPRVAVVPVSYVKLADSDVFSDVESGVKAFAEAATQKIINAFVDLKRFDVLDRTAVEAILKEQDFQMSDAVDFETGVELGAIKGAEIICVGQLQNVTTVPHYDKKKGDLMGYSGSVEMQIKITDVSTGSVVLSEDVKGDTKMSQSGLFSLVEKFENSPSKAAFEALNDAENRIKKELRQAYPVEGKIVEVMKSKKGKEKFLVSLGSEIGVKDGMKLLVIEQTMIEVDGKNFPREKEVGVLQVTKVSTDGIFSEAKAKDGGSDIIKKLDAGVDLIIRTKK